jgi:hypothetical protein
MPPKGAKGGKSKVSEPLTVEAKVFQTRSAKAGLQVCHVPYARLTGINLYITWTSNSFPLAEFTDI